MATDSRIADKYHPAIDVSCLEKAEARHLSQLMKKATSFVMFEVVMAEHLRDEPACELCVGALASLMICLPRPKGVE